MANLITAASKHVKILDEVYQLEAKSSILDSPAELARQGANVNEIIIPKLSMDGLANYDKQNGYAIGNVSLTYETKQYNYDRGKMFVIDSIEDEEALGIAFSNLANQFARTKVIPEVDAVRFALYSGKAGKKVNQEITDGAGLVAALRIALTEMDDNQVPLDQRYLFITSVKLGMIKDLDANKSREVLGGFAGIIEVPSVRFYTAIDLLADGYAKTVGAGNINFLVVYKPALMQFISHVKPKVVLPDVNQDADAYKYGYRIHGLNETYDNKVAGIYCNHFTV